LKQLAAWETTRGSFPTIKRNKSENGKKDEPVEVVDLSNENETEKHVIDVDTYIIDVLLSKVRQEPRTDFQDVSDDGGYKGCVIPEPVLSATAVAPPTQQKEQQGKMKPVLEPVQVEFKFWCHGSTLNYDKTAVLRVPLLQDPESGDFSLASGDVDIEGTFYPPLMRDTKLGNRFTGGIRFNKKGKAFLVLGLAWPEGKTCLVRAQKCDDSNTLRSWLTLKDSVLKKYRNNLHEWARKAGGIITFSSLGGCGTVLSENQMGSNMITITPGAVPNWARLEILLLKRNSAWDEETAKHGIEEYKKFLELRIKEDNLDAWWVMVAQSRTVELVWRAHLAFNNQYLQDVAAFATEIGEHLPSPVRVARRRMATYRYLGLNNPSILYSGLHQQRSSNSASGYESCY
jgi:hypothetical protein